MYKPPTKSEARALLDEWGLTEKTAAEIIDAGTQARGSRQISRYKSGETQMPWPVLYTLAGHCTKLKILKSNWRDKLLYMRICDEKETNNT